MDAVAAYLEMPPMDVYEVASFYSMYELKPVGRHKICVCTNISCLINGSERVVEHLEKRLGVGLGETTADGRYTLKVLREPDPRADRRDPGRAGVAPWRTKSASA